MVPSEGTPTFPGHSGVPADLPSSGYAPSRAGLPQTAEVGLLAAAAENERMIRRQAEYWNQRNMDGWEALLAPDVKWLVVSEDKMLDGPRAARDYVAGWAAAFPDSALEITSAVASPKGVALEYVFRGTHTRPLTTPTGVIEPTGRHIAVRATLISDMDVGKVHGARLYYDVASVMRGLGLIT